MKWQSADNRKGEVHFRSFHADYVDAHLPFVERLIEFRQDPLAHLAFDGISQSPFLEIGAELCINGMILENRIGASGVAADLSRDALLVADTYRQRLGMEHLPLRVCCDAYRLPFRNDSFPFVFGWGTFHHFPDPTPIFREARRVLHPDGLFFFDEEPIRRRLGLNLYNTDTPPGGLGRVETILFKMGLLAYIAVLGGQMEVKRGILEGTYKVKELLGALSVFNETKLQYSPQLTGGIPSEGTLIRKILNKLFSPERARRIATKWFGGAASGRCRKFERGLILQDGFHRNENGEPMPRGTAVMLVKRAPVHDRIGFQFKGSSEGITISIDGVNYPDVVRQEHGEGFTLETPVNEAGGMRDILTVFLECPAQGDLILEKVFLVSSQYEGSYYEYLPIDGVPRQIVPERMLGCCECVTVSDHCVADKCNRPCADAAPGEVDFAGGRAMIEPGKGLEAIYACPFKHIDRSPLVLEDGEYRCTNCGRRYPIYEGVVTLLPKSAEKELYGGG